MTNDELLEAAVDKLKKAGLGLKAPDATINTGTGGVQFLVVTAAKVIAGEGYSQRVFIEIRTISAGITLRQLLDSAVDRILLDAR